MIESFNAAILNAAIVLLPVLLILSALIICKANPLITVLSDLLFNARKESLLLFKESILRLSTSDCCIALSIVIFALLNESNRAEKRATCGASLKRAHCLQLSVHGLPKPITWSAAFASFNT